MDRIIVGLVPANSPARELMMMLETRI
jgi:hypothetical protein